MARDSDRIPSGIACLDTEALPATLVSTTGFNCEVWQSSGVIVRGDERVPVSFVVKRHRFACPLVQVRGFRRDHLRLREALDDIVPPALFVATRIDGAPSVIVLAEARTAWFDLARQSNEDEARPLLARLPKARAQLARFVAAARRWQRESRVLDLYGRENLVLDRDRNVCYLDSFSAFFYPDTAHVIGDIDDAFLERVDVSMRRLDYVESLLR